MGIEYGAPNNFILGRVFSAGAQSKLDTRDTMCVVSAGVIGIIFIVKQIKPYKCLTPFIIALLFKCLLKNKYVCSTRVFELEVPGTPDQVYNYGIP